MSPTPNLIRDQILSALNLDYLPEDDRIKLLDTMAEVVNQRLLIRVFDQLEAGKAEALKKLLDQGSDTELSDFMQTNVPQFLIFLSEEAEAVKAGLLEKIKSQK